MYLEQLSHQHEAISAIISALEKCSPRYDDNIYANPIISLSSGIDVKMETGTGKTYVYTRMMFEMFQKYGINKFIIFVPSLAIKEGTKSFITADYTRQHFSEIYENIKIDLDVINAGDFNTTKGRKTIPAALMDYLDGSRNDHKTIKCLLLNDAMLTSKSMTRDDYDQTLINACSCPLESISITRPVVIIDEPHRFNKSGRAWNTIQSISPQLIVRFGATFPLITIGTGRNKETKVDYENLVYDLNAVKAFNNGLVKGVDVFFPLISEEQVSDKYKVKSVTDRKLTLVHENTEFELSIGDKLPSDFEGGITYEGKKVLSNDLELSDGMILIPKLYGCTYQEALIQQALDAHFKTERENWVRENCGVNPAKIKTLSLFFIDDISSYRKSDGWIKQTFERLLRDKLLKLIEVENIPDYKDFLQASIDNISETHGGYFAEDTGKTGDEAIQSEVQDILKNKNKLLSFKEQGKWVLRRFLFSKWTLREGWDNPNVFTIAKLRSSGSENSKIQEVGRGLRLPVDETGKRLSDKEFRLNFIIDWSEKDFADKLCNQINQDGGIVAGIKITQIILEKLVSNGYATNTLRAKGQLLLDEIIDDKDNVLKVEELLKLLPVDMNLRKGTITTNQHKRAVVKLRKNNWDSLKDLWQKVVKRYMLKYAPLSFDEQKELAKKVLKDSFTPAVGKIICKRLQQDSNGNLVVVTTEVEQNIPLESLTYGMFLQKLSKRTQIGINVWHSALCSCYPNGINTSNFNNQSLENIISEFNSIFIDTFAQRFDYDALDFTANTSLIKNGNFVDEITQTLLGNELAEDVIIEDNYLYDKKCYDSEIEHNILRVSPQNKVKVFGKLPKKSIKVPTYTGGTTSPDFVYAVEKDNNIRLNLFVETKSSNERISDTVAVLSQKKLFNKLDNIEWRKVTCSDEINNIITKLIAQTT